MLSKSISERSAPHQGMGRFWKCFKAFSRNFRIQSGSDFMEEISSTTASDRPLFGLKTEWSGSLQPNRYPLLSSLRCSSWVTAMPPVYTLRSGKAYPADRIQNRRSEACSAVIQPLATLPPNSVSARFAAGLIGLRFGQGNRIMVLKPATQKPTNAHQPCQGAERDEQGTRNVGHPGKLLSLGGTPLLSERSPKSRVLLGDAIGFSIAES